MSINLDKLTIGEIKQINEFLTGKSDQTTPVPAPAQTNNTIGSDIIGKYVIVRSSNEGINASMQKKWTTQVLF